MRDSAARRISEHIKRRVDDEKYANRKKYARELAICVAACEAVAQEELSEFLALFSRDEALSRAQHAILVHWYARVRELSAMISARIRSDEAIENSAVGSSTEKKEKSGGGWSPEVSQLRPVEKQSYIQRITDKCRILFSGMNLKPETFELLHPHLLQLVPMLVLLIPVHKNEKSLEVLLQEAMSARDYDAFLDKHIPVAHHDEMRGALDNLLAAFVQDPRNYENFMRLTAKTSTSLAQRRPGTLSSAPAPVTTCRQAVAAQTAAEEIKSAPMPCA